MTGIRAPARSPTCSSPLCSRCCRLCWSRWARTPGWVCTRSTWGSACATACPRPTGNIGPRFSCRSPRTEPRARWSCMAWTAGRSRQDKNKRTKKQRERLKIKSRKILESYRTASLRYSPRKSAHCWGPPLPCGKNNSLKIKISISIYLYRYRYI